MGPQREVRKDAAVTDADVLFTAHREGIFRYLCRIVGSEDARELTQEVFLRVTRSGTPQTDEGGRRAWLFCSECFRDAGS